MNTLLIYPLGVIGPWQVVIIAVVILVLFGANKIPEFMKGLGKGVKSFKQGMKEVEKELEDVEGEEDKK
ncbi:MAG: twin-arginine translocase TatA/TatE family subunit [Bacteroidales bacterium]|jgi:sec-independent protein translocase protein TatA|nr:twin-arginine translocase TatA/TatE family subunit [Bacteroidales bacterium]